MLPLANDEVVHGKGSLLRKMPGDRWQQLANLRAYLAFMWAHPASSCSSWGPRWSGVRWAGSRELDWWLLDHPEHRGMSDLVRDLNKAYRRLARALVARQRPRRLQWIDTRTTRATSSPWVRRGSDGAPDVVCVANFAVPHADSGWGCPRPARGTRSSTPTPRPVHRLGGRQPRLRHRGRGWSGPGQPAHATVVGAGDGVVPAPPGGLGPEVRGWLEPDRDRADHRDHRRGGRRLVSWTPGPADRRRPARGRGRAHPSTRAWRPRGPPDDESAQRVATWSGLRRARGRDAWGDVDGRTVPTGSSTRAWRPTPWCTSRRASGRCSTPFLPRKRAISQLLARADDGRVLLCQLTYKTGLGPARRRGRGRRVAAGRCRSRGREELGLTIPAAGCCSPTGCGLERVGTTLCAWSSTAASTTPVCLDRVVRQTREIRVGRVLQPRRGRRPLCADFTARRIAAAVTNLDGPGPAYTGVRPLARPRVCRRPTNSDAGRRSFVVPARALSASRRIPPPL